MLQKTLFIDIETVSHHKHFEDNDDRLQDLWIKKSKLIAKDNTDYTASYQQSAAIYAEFGKIVCICLGYFTDKNLQEFKVKKIAGHDEKEILKTLFEIINKFVQDNTFNLCGHNIKEFDIPYICRRALINHLTLPNFLAELQLRKPWENPLIDTLHLWRFGDYKHYTSLDLLAAVLDVPSPKSDIDGSQVSSVYYHENDLDRIAEYCSRDVVTVAQIMLRFNNLALLNQNKITLL